VKVLRLCSVFEPPLSAVTGRGARFDPLGGVQSHTAGLSRALDRQGVAQTIITTRPPTAARHEPFGDHGEVVRLGLPVRVCRQFYSWPATAVAPRLARDADIVHVHLGEDLAVVPLGMMTARRHRLPLVITVHTSLRHTLEVSGVRSALLKSLGGGFEWWGTRGATAVITLTERLAERLRYDGVPADRVHVIPSGVVLPPLAVTGPGSDPDTDPLAGVPHPRVIFLGRLTPQKHVDVLIRALGRTPDAHLVVVGDGPHRPALERLAGQLELDRRVHFLGFVPHADVSGILRRGDALALPSRYEEFGTALLEGMQAGLPVVAAATGGIPNVISHGVNGLLVPPGDDEALAAGLRQLLTDSRLAARLAGQARLRAQGYDWDRLSTRVLSVYRGLVSAPPPAAGATAAVTP
jgi:glycosyltransferase involved in cell wall biosynthesis